MIRGGLRTRLIGDSVRITIVGALTSLGWFDGTIHDTPPGPRRHLPLRYVPSPLPWTESVEANLIAISTEDTRDEELGLGGDVEDHIRMYADVFAQSDELGWQIAGDIHAILNGKMPHIGRHMAAIDVYDLRQPTPAPFTQVDVEAPLIDRAESESREWRNRWFMVRFDLVDEYHDEYGTFVEEPADWTDDMAAIWREIQAVEAGT